MPAGIALGPVETLCILEDERVFTEGPAMGPDGNVYFSNIRMNRIMRFNPGTGALGVFRENSNAANGLLFEPSGRLLICEGSAGRITHLDLDGGEYEVLASEYRGRPILDVNDLARDAKGRLYFSSRPEGADPAGEIVNAVYRRDPDGHVERLLAWPEVEMPNGLAVSPDQRSFYLIDSNAKPGGRRVLEAFDLGEDGSLANRRVLHDFAPGRGGDGMCVDPEGRLYVAAGLRALRNTSETLDTLAGLHVFSPHGQKLAFAEAPEDVVTNCTFGTGAFAETLFVTCGRRLLSIAVESLALLAPNG